MKKLLFMLAICSLALIPATFLAFPTVFPTGTTIYKPDKAWNGYNIFPAKGIGPVLIDMGVALLEPRESPIFSVI